MALTDKLTAIANAIRGKTGKEDALTLDQMATEIAGIQTGGGGSSFGENTVTPNFLNLFYALENGTAVTGEFTLANYLPNTETLIFDSGLSEIKGIFFIDADYAYTATGATPEYGAWGLYMTGATGRKDIVTISGLSNFVSASDGNGYTVSYKGFIVRGTYRIDGGALYVTAQYNQNNAYTPFCKGHRYKWVAW